VKIFLGSSEIQTAYKGPNQVIGAAPVPFTLWGNGFSPAPINVYDQAAPLVLTGANYLADVIQSACGIRPTVTQSPIGFKQDRSVLIGYPAPTELEPEEILIYCGPKGPLWITGYDEFDSDSPNWVGQVTETNFMTFAGSYHAIMTFAQEVLGVVVGWPGVTGEAIPTAVSKVLTPFVKRHKPICMVRNYFQFSAVGNSSPFSLSKDWIKKNRGFYSLQTSAGHSFTTYYNRFHPNGTPGGNREDIFALQPDNTRSGWPFGNNAKMEVGDPALVDVWFDVNVTEELAARPLKRSFGTQFNDGQFLGHSVDPRAIAMDYLGDDADMFTFFWANSSEVRPATTDREVVFSNRCSRKLKEEFPDNEFYTTMLAYGPTRYMPRREVPDENLIIVNVANDFNHPQWIQDGKVSREEFDKWSALNGNFKQVWRPNIGRGYGHGWGMWLTDIHQIGNRLKQIIPLGCTGFTPDYFGENWANQWPMYYLLTKLLWDHTLDIDEVMDEAYEKLFGPAAEHVKAYYEATEDVIVNSRGFTSWDFKTMTLMWTEERLDEFQDHLDLAFAATTESTNYRFRVEWVQAGLDWSKAVMECVRYSLLYDLPITVTDETNVTQRANAIEDDTNATTGWSLWLNTSEVTLSVQSTETNGSNFAFHMVCSGPNSSGIVTTLPGSPSLDYICTVDLKHAGFGGRCEILINGVQTGLNIFPSDVGWKTRAFLVKGGDQVGIREVNPAGGRQASCYIDNFTMRLGTLLDTAQINADWQQVVDDATAAINDAKWSSLRPISQQPLISSQAIPKPNVINPPPLED
jgi:hypothetical protein